MKPYNHSKIEKKWQKLWQKSGVYKQKEDSKKEKCYVLDMFPYPSGVGLHVGHPKGYIGTDVYSRFKVANGYSVLHPMGWDAFGLPAENYAIKNKIHPRKAVDQNIKYFKKQLSILGFSYDWDREVDTTDEEYYKWTQWIFLQMWKKGLAYESNEPINWCPSCKTGLANEDLEADGTCERCGSVVEKKPLRQWVLKITKYAERLLEDLGGLKNWPNSVIESQKNWIGKSEGAIVKFDVVNSNQSIEVFTTRIDTIFSGTFVVLSPEHRFLSKDNSLISNYGEIEKYIKQSGRKSEIDRTKPDNKDGVEVKGVKVINPATNEEMSVWVADFVLGHYGTGAVFADAHDKRDFDMAKKYGIPLKVSIKPVDEKIDFESVANLDVCYEGEGILFNSGQFDGMSSAEARPKIIDWLRGKGKAERKISYKLQDWVFSRQRYWGEPIPLIHCDQCGIVPVPEKDLPVVLPNVKSYEPSGTGESPLAKIDKWVNTKCPECGGKGKRETNTMPQWAGSCWYYLRYMDPKNKKAFVDPKKEKYWAPVDVYVGGAEHATRHLIYARFWHKFLYDLKLVSTKEPFDRLINQGLIMGSDGRKMSKRFGNVVNPDDIVEKYGADTLRIYEMFMGPFEGSINWSTESMIGSRRFIERVWGLQDKVSKSAKISEKTEIVLNQTIKKVTEDIENFSMNTAVAQLMILVNAFESEESIDMNSYKTLLLLLSPFAPHITEEIWSNTEKGTIIKAKWPEYDKNKLSGNTVIIAIQVNGKVRETIEVEKDASEETVKKMAMEAENVKKWLNDKDIKKIIYVKNKIINIVVV